MPIDAKKKTERGAASRWLDVILANSEHGKQCIVWPFRIKENGYGQVGNCYSKKHPHRVVCEAFKGPPPFNKAEAAHSCNNRACCNPNHLSWKTHSENQRDRRAHGTSNMGEASASAKLTEADVVELRRIYAKGGYRHKDLAKMFGVSPATIGLAIQGRTWGHVREGLTHA